MKVKIKNQFQKIYKKFYKKFIKSRAFMNIRINLHNVEKIIVMCYNN